MFEPVHHLVGGEEVGPRATRRSRAAAGRGGRRRERAVLSASRRSQWQAFDPIALG